MMCPDHCRLLFGPYHPPRVRPGRKAYCNYRGCVVKVTKMTDARIPWPRCQQLGVQGGSGLLADDELQRAVESESAAAIRYWFGVGVSAIWCWRRAFGVGRMDSPGSRRAIEAAGRLGAEATKRRQWTPAERRQRSRAAKRLRLGRNLQPCPRPGGSRPWTRSELRLLWRMPDAEIAKRIGRTPNAVRQKRENEWAAAIES